MNIDIIFLDSDKIINTIHSNVSTSSYPQSVFTSSEPSKYVIELNAGDFAKLKLNIGDKIDFKY
jgi:uncharacterized membrane protein (UPF0127 family)